MVHTYKRGRQITDVKTLEQQAVVCWNGRIYSNVLPKIPVENSPENKHLKWMLRRLERGELYTVEEWKPETDA